MDESCSESQLKELCCLHKYIIYKYIPNKCISVHAFIFFPPALENADSDIGLCGWLLVGLSILLMLVTLPISIWMCIKVSCWSNPVFIFHFTSKAGWCSRVRDWGRPTVFIKWFENAMVCTGDSPVLYVFIYQPLLAGEPLFFNDYIKKYPQRAG